VIPRFIFAFLDERRPVVYGDGRAVARLHLHRQCVEANLLAAGAKDVAAAVFNIACGERITLNRLLGELRSLTGKDIEAIHEAGRPGDVPPHSLADISADGTRSDTSLRSTFGRVFAGPSTGMSARGFARAPCARI